MARSDQTAWLVRILEGPLAGQAIRLEGRSLPYRAGAGGAVSFGREQRTQLTWYPGNREASQQIIGPTLMPTTINGIWKERYLGTDVPINLAETFEELCSSGVQVSVFWQTIEYQGIVKRFVYNPGDPVGGLGDLRWEVTFEWNRDLSTRRAPVVGNSDLELRSTVVRAAAALSDLGNLVEAFIGDVNIFVGLAKTSFQPTKRILNDSLNGLVGPINTLATTAGRMANEIALPSSTLEAASSAAGESQTVAGKVSDVAANIFPASQVVSDGLESILGDAIVRADIVDQSFLALTEVFNVRVRLEEIIRPPEFTIITPVPGSDLRLLAIEYYGDADLWPRIAKQNGLVDSAIPDDVDEIIIPLSLPDATDDRIGAS